MAAAKVSPFEAAGSLRSRHFWIDSLMHKNHFELFGLPERFSIDLQALDQLYRKIQGEVHPDRFAAGSSAERLKSMQLATAANEAYQTLKNPTSRARHLLQLKGVETEEDSNTAMPADFLMLQMEWREAIEEAVAAGDIDALDDLLSETRKTTRQLQQQLHAQLDEADATVAAAETVRKLSFIDKVQADIGHAISKLQDV